MEQIVFVKPLPNLIVRDPKTMAPVPENGMTVPLIGSTGKYWRRRIKDGSLIIIKEKKVEKMKTFSNFSNDKKGGKE